MKHMKGMEIMKKGSCRKCFSKNDPARLKNHVEAN